MKKKIISLMTVLTMLMSLAVLPARAAESGTCGDNLTWTLEDGVLTISGTGEMWDYDYLGGPWDEYKNEITDVIIIDGVTSVGDRAFADCINLINVDIPIGVTEIGISAFYGCNSLKKVEIPYGVEIIGGYAFFRCSNLINISIPESVIQVGGVAFYGTPWYDSLPDGPIYINNVFYDYKGEIEENTTLVLREGTIYVSDALSNTAFPNFEAKNITNVVFPENEIWIEGRAFDRTGWFFNHDAGLIYVNDFLYGYRGVMTEPKSVIIKEGIKYINEWAFFTGFDQVDCENMSSVLIPSSVIYIGRSAFYNCKNLSEIKIPAGVSHIYKGTFGYCTGLKNITIPAGVTEIEDSAFEECTSLTDVYYGGSEEEWERIHIGSNNEALLNATIHYGRETAPSMGDCSTESMSFTETDGGCTVSSEVRNNTGSEIPCIVYSAVYSSDGVLKACRTSEEIIFGNDVSEVSISVPCMAEKGDIIKTFVWKDADGEPLAEKEEITV